jgi:hypothetical protein
MMAKRLRFAELRRRGAVREPKRRFLIVCEGSRTEPLYFRALSREFRNQLVEIEIEGQGQAPKSLVERAAARKKEAEREARSRRDLFLRFDEVWCVFDVDEHLNIAEARQQARDNGIQVAISNPRFELWVLLHFQEQSAFLDRSRACSLLRKHLPGYEKILPFESIKAQYGAAVGRARNLDQRCESAGCPGDNPSTGVYRLTEDIRDGSFRS